MTVRSLFPFGAVMSEEPGSTTVGAFDGAAGRRLWGVTWLGAAICAWPVADTATAATPTPAQTAAWTHRGSIENFSTKRLVAHANFRERLRIAHPRTTLRR